MPIVPVPTPGPETAVIQSWLRHRPTIPGAVWDGASQMRSIINNIDTLSRKISIIEAQNAEIISLLRGQNVGCANCKDKVQDSDGGYYDESAYLRHEKDSVNDPVDTKKLDVQTEVMGLIGPLLATLHRSWLKKNDKQPHLTHSAECTADAVEFRAYVESVLDNICGEDKDLQHTLDRLTPDIWDRVYVGLCEEHPDIFGLMALQQLRLQPRITEGLAQQA